MSNKKLLGLFLCFTVALFLGLNMSGCGAGSSGTVATTTTPTTATSTTTGLGGTTTTTTSGATTTVTLGILTQSPTVGATGVLSTETLSVTFSKAISFEGMTVTNFFTTYAALSGFHNAGQPDLSSASLTWDAGTNTLYLSGITGWSNYGMNANYKVYASPLLNQIKDLSGLSLGTTNDLWSYTLQYIQNPYDGDPINPAVFTHYVSDEVGDAIEGSMPGQSTYYFDENDIKSVSAALVNDRLVVSVEVVGLMDNTLEATGIGTNEIDYRDISIGLDLDNNNMTGYAPGGDWGMDIQITLYRGLGVYPDCQYGVYEFNETDTHVISREAGQMHAGGQGYRYAVFSAPVSAVDYLGITIEAGMTYRIMGWSEAETQNGMLDFAADTISSGGTTRIETVLGGN